MDDNEAMIQEMVFDLMKRNMKEKPNYYVSEQMKVDGQYLLTLYEGMLPNGITEERYHDLLQEAIEEYLHEVSQSSGQVR